MATTVNRKLQRQSSTAVYSGGRARSVIVELEPPGSLIGFRLKGTRRTYRLPVDWCYREALRAEIARVKLEKRKAKGVKQ